MSEILPRFTAIHDYRVVCVEQDPLFLAMFRSWTRLETFYSGEKHELHVFGVKPNKRTYEYTQFNTYVFEYVGDWE